MSASERREAIDEAKRREEKKKEKRRKEEEGEEGEKRNENPLKRKSSRTKWTSNCRGRSPPDFQSLLLLVPLIPLDGPPPPPPPPIVAETVIATVRYSTGLGRGISASCSAYNRRTARRHARDAWADRGTALGLCTRCSPMGNIITTMNPFKIPYLLHVSLSLSLL